MNWKFWKKKVKVPHSLKQQKVDGQEFLFFEEPLKAPYGRVLAFLMAMHETQLGIQKGDLKAFTVVQRKAFNEGDFTRAAAYLEYLSDFISLYAYEDNIMKIANSFILLPGENLQSPDQSFFNRKSELVKSSEKIKAFFLSETFLQIKSLTGSEIDINLMEYFQDPAVKMAGMLFFQSLRSTTRKTTSTKSTKASS